jgi:hypothetical protein
MSAEHPAAQDRVIEVAREWRRVYLKWVVTSGEHGVPRDLSENGENLALSELLDALEALDEAEVKAPRV